MLCFSAGFSPSGCLRLRILHTREMLSDGRVGVPSTAAQGGKGVPWNLKMMPCLQITHLCAE